VFWLAVVFGAAGLVAAVVAVGTAIGSVHRASVNAGHLDLGGLPLSYPDLNAAEWLLISLAAAGATAITIACRATWRQRVAYRNFLGELEVIGRLDGHPSVKVIADSRPEAFCAGYLKPGVYISTGALASLTIPQLEAVLAHEHHHQLVRDPLRFAVGRILARALFFVPVLRPLVTRDADLAELNADGAAVRASAGRQDPLASALLMFDAAAPAGVSGISSARVDSLLGEPVRWRLPLRLMAVSVVALAALSVLIWQVSGPASVRATLNVPFVSSRPCVAMALIPPLLGSVAAVRRRARTSGIPRRV
jgi:Zn-dependent protease with chaperone function